MQKFIWKSCYFVFSVSVFFNYYYFTSHQRGAHKCRLGLSTTVFYFTLTHFLLQPAMLYFTMTTHSMMVEKMCTNIFTPRAHWGIYDLHVRPPHALYRFLLFFFLLQTDQNRKTTVGWNGNGFYTNVCFVCTHITFTSDYLTRNRRNLAKFTCHVQYPGIYFWVSLV